MNIALQLEVVGCPTVCLHCWAQGIPYAAMPLEDIRWALEEACRACAADGHELVAAFPMHEVAAHPQAPDIMRLFIANGFNEFEPLATTGVPIAMRDDWEAFLTAIGQTGTKTFWVAFHGSPSAHDRLVHREGAFEETYLAVQRIRSLGFRCGANVFVTRETTPSFDVLADTLQALGLEEMSWEPPFFYATARSRRYETHRPEVDDLHPIAGRVLSLTGFHQEQWRDLAAVTEASWVRQATGDDWPGSRADLEPSGVLGLVCRPNLDLHTGKAGLYGTRHGNLRQDGVAATLRRAVELGPCSDNSLLRLPAKPPPVQELARDFGEANGRKVHFDSTSMHFLWLDRAASARKN